MKATFLTALMICLALGTAVSQDASTSNRKIPPCLNRKKVIALGFSSLNQKELRKHLETAENYLPADGLVIHLDVTAEVDGKPFKAFRHSVFKGVTWKREWFKEAEEDLKAIHPRQFTDNFLYIATTGYHSNLFDDTTWASICNNAGILAAIAKDCGLKGIFFDIEHYNGDNVWPAFKYDTECGKTFEECEQQARKRGREMMTAIATEYPDITMVAVLGSYSINFPALNSLDVKARLKDELYGLSPAFFDGMFEVLPPQGKLYDGTEFPGYMADCAEDYQRIAHNFLTLTPQLCAPELRNKLLTQSGPACALYMECFTNTKGFWQISSPFMDQVTLFRRNLYHALQASTEYTWIYFDAAAKWYPITLEKYYEDKLAQNGGGKARLWRELLPGIDNAILAARNPLAYAKAQLQAGQAKLICKEDFESGQLNMTTWSSKQAGTIEVDNTQGASSKASASLKGVKSGSIYFSIPVTPGEMYLLRAKAKSLRPENKLTLCGKSGPVWAVEAGFSNPDPQGWMQAETTLFVPDKVKELSMHCGVQSKVEPWSDCRFDDVELYLIK